MPAALLPGLGLTTPEPNKSQQALAAKIACPILWLPRSSDQLLPASAIGAFAEHLLAGRLAVCRLDRDHQSTSAPVGSPEFEFYGSHTADFFREGS